ncbi:glucose 1-dehydrogenase [Myxococcota bacterium]|nr:glucose 1-dehydrogenase [Myxococcota bacterium]
MSTPYFDLSNKVAIVTGASRGIGESMARGLAAHGAKVVIAARKLEGLEAVAQSIRDAGGDALAVACHTGKESDVDALVKAALDRHGKIDVLVNNAATNPYFGPMLDIEWGAFDKTFEVNVKGYFMLARAVARHLVEREAPGSIINVSSVAGIQGAPLQGVYGMTKAAVISMTKTLAIELGARGVRVNAIAPGFIDTRFSSALTGSDEIVKTILSRTPLNRIGQPEDLAGLAIYLASDASSFVTGATFLADGGLLAG